MMSKSLKDYSKLQMDLGLRKYIILKGWNLKGNVSGRQRLEKGLGDICTIPGTLQATLKSHIGPAHPPMHENDP